MTQNSPETSEHSMGDVGTVAYTLNMDLSGTGVSEWAKPATCGQAKTDHCWEFLPGIPGADLVQLRGRFHEQDPMEAAYAFDEAVANPLKVMNRSGRMCRERTMAT